MTSGALCLVLLAAGQAAAGYPGFRIRPVSSEDPETRLGAEAGERLILTSYVEAGRAAEARNLSKVTGGPFPPDIPSYSGFFTVDKRHGSNLFFWFFPAERDYENAPVLVWLQGGPGASSLYGLFMEVGPFFVSEDGESLIRNPYSWHKNHSIVFIDNPVGTGFSFTKKDAGYVTTQEEVGEQLHSALEQFFVVFPELQKNHFFICGESYAGKYIPALGRTIHEKNRNASLKINLKGMAIGDGLVDPVHMVQYSDLVYQWGLVDNTTWKQMKKLEDATVQLIEAEEYKLAVETMNDNLGIIGSEARVGVYNLLTDNDDIDNHYAKLLEKASVRAAIHVGKQTYYPSSDVVYDRLRGDIMKSVRPWVEELLDSGYHVVFYNGQLDIIVGYPLTVSVLERLRFNAAQEYKTASRKAWLVDGRVAGYTKTAGNMTEVLVRGAGHMVPSDQPAAGFQLIYSITRGTLR
ncbi:venom serine carboxypeptidase-like [Bacillus rossius redtenbacheri]|uniref:venom serine carboxypeptidase-like n=1 Tax=Bacillus rossius redtenbacheri TaxID=93214 RepID=UPI002FDD2D8D